MDRINRSKENAKPPNYVLALSNLCVNLLFWFLTNFYSVLYYYFFPLLGVIIQFMMFFD